MKTLLFACILALTVAVAPAGAAVKPIDITVTGQGTVTKTPDLATFGASIITNDDLAQNATSANNATYERFIAAMRGLGVPGADITTTSYTVTDQPRPEPAPSGAAPVSQPNVRYGFIVERSLSVRLHDVGLAGKAIDAAVAAGVTNFNGIEFGTADNRGAYAQALRGAVADAASQASAMAGAAHLRILGIKSIQQGYANVARPMMLRASETTDSYKVPTTLPPSSVSVEATVTITYLATP